MASPPRQAHYLVVSDDKGQREFVLEAPIYSIGRSPDCNIRLISQFVSRRHATLVRLSDQSDRSHYRIIDGNLKGKCSSNGLLINRVKTQAQDLQHGDEIIFGPGVSAAYYELCRDGITTMPGDEDSTLIPPSLKL